MRIELYSVENDENGIRIKAFLEKNNLPFKEIITNDIYLLQKAIQSKLPEKISVIKVIYNHSIHVCRGFNEIFLNQIIEHITKYKPRIEK